MLAETEDLNLTHCASLASCERCHRFVRLASISSPRQFPVASYSMRGVFVVVDTKRPDGPMIIDWLPPVKVNRLVSAANEAAEPTAFV